MHSIWHRRRQVHCAGMGVPVLKMTDSEEARPYPRNGHAVGDAEIETREDEARREDVHLLGVFLRDQWRKNHVPDHLHIARGGHIARVAIWHRWPYCAGGRIARVPHCTGGLIVQVAILQRWPYCTIMSQITCEHVRRHLLRHVFRHVWSDTDHWHACSDTVPDPPVNMCIGDAFRHASVHTHSCGHGQCPAPPG